MRSSISISGPDCYGLSSPEVIRCIEGLEGAELCDEYVKRKRQEYEKNEMDSFFKTDSHFDDFMNKQLNNRPYY